MRRNAKLCTRMAPESLDPLVFGHRLRHFRRQAGMTLEALGRAVGRPPSYLSQLENGHREPRLSTVNQLAAALGCRPADLLAADRAQPPGRARGGPGPHAGGPPLPVAAAALPAADGPARRRRPGAPGGAVRPGRASCRRPPGRRRRPASGAARGARAANAAMRDEMRKRDNYFEEIERAAGAGPHRGRLRRPGRGVGAPPDRPGRLLRLHHRPGPGPAPVDPVDQRPAPPGHLRAPAQPDRRHALGPLGDRPDPRPLRPRAPRPGRLRGLRPPAGGGQLLRRRPAGARAGRRADAGRRQGPRGHLRRGPQRDASISPTRWRPTA